MSCPNCGLDFSVNDDGLCSVCKFDIRNKSPKGRALKYANRAILAFIILALLQALLHIWASSQHPMQPLSGSWDNFVVTKLIAGAFFWVLTFLISFMILKLKSK